MYLSIFFLDKKPSHSDDIEVLEGRINGSSDARHDLVEIVEDDVSSTLNQIEMVFLSPTHKNKGKIVFRRHLMDHSVSVFARPVC